MKSKYYGFVVLAILVGGAAAARAYTIKPAAAEPTVQDLVGLDNRIRTLEQRMFSIESNITRLEQRIITSQSTSGATTNIRDAENSLIRSELATLKLRLGELECATLRLDERTLPSDARSGASQNKDLCRGNPKTPIRLSARP